VNAERFGERGRALLAELRARRSGELGPGVEIEVEVYEKRGRSRSFERGPLGDSSLQSIESGWAVRGGDRRGSYFAAGAGETPVALDPPVTTPHPLRLPEARPPRPWRDPAGLESPLAGENEARALVDGIARELERELGGTLLESARLDDGASESALVSSRGVAVRWRSRSTALRLVARRGAVSVAAELVARAAAELKPLAVARRVADRLSALEAPPAPPASGALLLAAPLAARLLEAYAPRLVGAGAPELLRVAAGGDRRIAAVEVTVVDDGGRVGGLLAAPCDGEGVPTGAATLIAGGELVAPLRAWWESEGEAPAPGCMRRPGWRDLPRRAPAELALEPAARIAVADLVAELGSGAYLIAPEGAVRVDAAGDAFTVAVSGYAVEGGRATRPLGPCRLSGRLSTWMLGVRARARDLTWVPGDGLYGAPSLIVEGLELGV